MANTQLNTTLHDSSRPVTRVAIASPEGPVPIFPPNPLLCAITRYYPLIRAKSFKFSGLFGTILELFSARNPQSASHSRHTSPADPHRPLFNGQWSSTPTLFSGPTTRPETVFGANHQPIQLSKNPKSAIALGATAEPRHRTQPARQRHLRTFHCTVKK